MTTLFMTVSAVAGVISGPLSGMLMTALHGVHGLAGWRWMFLLEALPSVLAGVMIFVWLPDSPRQAKWLNSIDRDRLVHDLAAAAPPSVHHAGLRKSDAGSILLFATLYFLLLSALYGINFWLPTIIGFAGIHDALSNGWLSAIPYACAAIVMNLVARRADRKRHGAWHVGISALLAGTLTLSLGTQRSPRPLPLPPQEAAMTLQPSEANHSRATLSASTPSLRIAWSMRVTTSLPRCK